MKLDTAQKYIKSIDWRAFKKLASPNVSADLNAFLEKMPQNAGTTMLTIAGVCWGVALAAGLYTTVQLQHLTELRTSLQEAKALKPKVPQIKDVAVGENDVKIFVEKIKDTYTGLTIKNTGASIEISAASTAAFGQFREAMGHVQNGGSGWRVSVQSLCVGRECGKMPLSATLNINKVSVN